MRFLTESVIYKLGSVAYHPVEIRQDYCELRAYVTGFRSPLCFKNGFQGVGSRYGVEGSEFMDEAREV